MTPPDAIPFAPGPVAAYLGAIRLGKPQAFGSLTMLPVLSDAQADVSYMLLDQALEQGLQIRETGDAGTVPLLCLLNRTRHRVLILDGEELVGAKQNRIVNTSILVAPWATLELPVSCVEQGRWRATSGTFGADRRMMYATLRARKSEQVLRSVRDNGTFRTNQHEIWRSIEERTVVRRVSAPTGAMADLYTTAANDLESYRRALRPVEGQVGALFAVGDKVAGLECLGRSDMFAQVFDKLVQSYALDALEVPAIEIKPANLKRKAKRFIAALCKAAHEARPSPGEGIDQRLVGKTLTGLALTLDDSLLHLSAFPAAA